MSGKAPKSEEGQSVAHKDEPTTSHAAPTHAHGHLPHSLSIFLEKVKRRNVGRVAILYIVVCYLILEPFEMFFHLLELPAWTGRTAVFLMVLGFPAALLFAWIYEITPSGIKPSVEVDPRQSISRQTGRKLDRAIIAVLAVALTYFVIDKFWISKRVAVVSPVTVAPAVVSAPPMPAIPEKSVAVLPFVDMSEKKDQEYFADGLSEELIDHLAHSENLKVIARTSSFQFKGKNADIREIGQRLGVANLLEGSVRRSGDTMRVTAQLVSVADGAHRWSETYDRKMGDIFKVQDEIAAAVVTALKVSLTGELTSRLSVTSSVDAYTDYLQGRQLLHNAITKADLDTALDLFRKSVSADPTFAEGWQYVMGALNNEVMAGYVAANAVQVEMRHAASEVAKLAPGSSNAHRSAAQIAWVLDFDAPAAAAEYQQAYDLDPRAPTLAKQLADALFSLDGDDALVLGLFQEAVSLDPLQADTYVDLAAYHLASGRLKDAEAALTKARVLAPKTPGIDAFLCEVFIAGGHPAEALTAAQREIDESSRRFALALAYQALGRRNEADAAMAEAEQKDAPTSPYGSAQLHAFRGETDQAFAQLERAFQQRDYGVMLTNTDWLLKNLHGDPRWRPFLRKMKLPSSRSTFLRD